jgi:alkanesulfonate monooxygenase SsuD/methylene tetrahydromethanopterin reductase-like flavin-dependent oxidoreductase (luciferase family)
MPSLRIGFKLPNCGGVMCEPDWARPDTLLRLAALSEQVGYDSVWLHDHVLTPAELDQVDQQHIYDPLSVMAVVAASVPRIGVGIATLILPLRDPVLTARQMSTLHAFFPDRLVFAFGSGQYKSEFLRFGTDVFHRRGKVTDEYLSIIEALFTQDVANYQGQFRSVSDAKFFPKPATPPQIWIGGNSAAAARRAKRFASRWVVSQAVAPQTITQVRAEVDLPGEPFSVALTATATSTPATPDAEDHRLHQHATVVSGDAEAVTATLLPYLEAGVTELLMSFRSRSLEHMTEQIAWFASDVRPLLDKHVERIHHERGVG